MAYIGRQNLGGAYRQLDDISSGFDGSDTTHTMQVNSANVTVGDVNQIILSLGGVIQKPGTDFTVSGSVLTFTTAPAANTSFFAVLLGSDNGGTVTPTDASVTVSKLAIAGGEVKLDADGDTSITADTDDQIDIKIGGADDFAFKANNFEVQSGSTIDMNGQELILDADADTSITADTDDQIDFKCAGKDTISINQYGQTVHKRDSATTFGGSVSFMHQRGTIASPSIVNSGDAIGLLQSSVYDGTSYLNGPRILLAVDGTPGDDDMPTRIVFQTTADGTAGTLAETFRVSNNGMATFSPGTNSRYYKIDPDVDSFYPTVNNVSDLGYSNLKWDDVYATNGTIQTSDKNVKDNITTSDLGLDFVNKLKPVSYKFKEKTRTHYGLIAQDIEEVLSDISKSTTGFAGFIKTQKEDHSIWTKDDSETQGDNPTAQIGQFKNPLGTKVDGEYSYALRYEEFISPIIKAIQELAVKVKALEDA
jgi:hypothetical protein